MKIECYPERFAFERFECDHSISPALKTLDLTLPQAHCVGSALLRMH